MKTNLPLTTPQLAATASSLGQRGAVRSALVGMLLSVSVAKAATDPLLSSWLTTESGKYARVYLTDADRVADRSVTTWTGQTLPAYAGVLQIAETTDWVYIKTSSLGFHTLGPWYGNAAHTESFPNWPKNQLAVYRFPRTTTVPATRTNTGGGGIGYFVDGVTMFDGRDAQVWNGTSETGMGTGSWERDAWINEGVTFDPAQAHQENTGTYHYHANPIALRYRLGDHVEYDPATKLYRESSEPVTAHSPILGWIRDGCPIYGPYGYSDPLNAQSGLRRMRSGFQLRNGEHGTDNLTSVGRKTLPAWAVRRGFAAQTGPDVSSSYPLGRYIQDNAYLGDLGSVQGTDFDLDEFNGRFCVTPEFPQGVYAYFVTINDDGSPHYPYLIGRAFYGSPTGASATLSGQEKLYFDGTTNRVEQLRLANVDASRQEVTLVWNSLEGGTYRVESSGDLETWNPLATAQAAEKSAQSSWVAAAATPAPSEQFYRVIRTALNEFDSVGGSSGGGGGNGATQPITRVTPNQGNRGTTVTLTCVLGGMTPPTAIRPSSAFLGTLAGSNVSRSGANVTATFVIPESQPLGALTVRVVFPGPPNMGDVTFSLTDAFTVK